MSEHAFDTFARRAAVPRRASLLALGAAVGTGVLAPTAAKAKKRGKKNKKCKKQVAQCREGLETLCIAITTEFSVGFEAGDCFDFFAGCCEFLKTCRTHQAFLCAAEVVENIDT